jgi:putative two-component system response regulator
MKKILIVDDNLASLKQISSQLTGRYAVTLAKSGGQALQICARERPDLILLDVEMPEMDGFQTIRSFKADPELAKIPVIFLTGNHDTATELKGLESGAVDFITKPVEMLILLNRIQLHVQYSSCQISLEKTVKELQSNIILSFAELIECRDHSSGGHVLRTGKYTRLLGQALLERETFKKELTQEKLELIVQATFFHDIGKLGISDTLLLKQAALSDEEFTCIKTHTLIGAKVLEHIYELTPTHESFAYAIEMARSHHERYDGLGYPQGLKAEGIPLGVRIMSLANVYDACVTDRVYRKAMSHEEVCALIHEGRGTRFDPRIEEVFESISDQFLALSQEYASLADTNRAFY